MNYAVQYQVGLQIDNPTDFHVLSLTQKNYVRGEMYAHVLDVAKELKTELYPNLPPPDSKMLNDLSLMLPPGWTADPTPSNITVEHVYRNGHWICDTNLVLEEGLSAAVKDVDVDLGASVVTITCSYFLTISSGHDWEGK